MKHGEIFLLDLDKIKCFKTHLERKFKTVYLIGIIFKKLLLILDVDNSIDFVALVS